METFLKISSQKKDSNCNCISPFNFKDLDGKINPSTGKYYTQKDKEILQNNIFKYSQINSCDMNVCCSPNDSYQNIDTNFFNQFKKLYPSVNLMKENNNIDSILLSKVKKNEPGWMEPTPYIVCKVSKANIDNTDDNNIDIASNVVKDCFTDSCDNLEKITIFNINNNQNKYIEKDFEYTAFDDARVTQAIKEGNKSYVKEYIKKYGMVDNILTNDDYKHRMIHISANTDNLDILKMLLALNPDINVKNKHGNTPLHLAADKKLYDNVEELIKLGADVNLKNNKGEIPMFISSKLGDYKLIRLFYNSGSNHLSLDNNRNNAVNVCIMHAKPSKDKIEIINYFLERGLDPEHVNINNKTTLEIIKDEIDKEFLIEKANFLKKQKQNKNLKNTKESFTVSNLDYNNLSNNHKTLLEIQTLIFNAIIRANPNKYDKYINVSEIPKGSPIEVLDTLCVGEGNIDGTENSLECISKGGKIIKVDEPSTMIKLDLLPVSKSAIDEQNENELYLKKLQKKNNINKTTDNLENYNKNLHLDKTLNNKLNNKSNSVDNNNNVDDIDTLKEDVKELIEEDLPHPTFVEEDNSINLIEKSKVSKLNNNNNNNIDTTEDNHSNSIINFLEKYQLVLIIITVILIALILSLYLYKKNVLSFVFNPTK